MPEVFHAMVKDAIFGKYGETDSEKLDIIATSMEVTLNTLAKGAKAKLESLPRYSPDDIQAVAEMTLVAYKKK